MQAPRVSDPKTQLNCVILYDAYTCRWLYFRRPVTVLMAHSQEEVLPLLDTIQTQVEQQRLYAAGFVSYEAAPAFDSALQVNSYGNFPLAWFGLYTEVEAIALPAIASLQPIQPLDWRASIAQTEYEQAIDKIKFYIQQGQTYQVNFSFRLLAPFEQDPWAYFVQMIHAQQCLYGAFINTTSWTICSSSPELFFQQVGQELFCRPMKGTAARGLTYLDDLRLAEWLQASEKNRAENLMIVDMVRNDFARVALGSVQVPQLFEVEKYPTLWQMTSSVLCETKAGLREIFQALFPPASITGAPKPRTMQIIAELESTPRRIYTGTIGFIMPQRSQFNVAIRTVLIDKNKQSAEYGVGSGVIWDSRSGDEFAECYTKARVLTQPPVDFSLLETLLWTPDSGYFLLDLHLIRLQQSAAYFAFALDLERIRQKLQAIAQTFPLHAQKVRILVSKQGEFTCQSAAMVNDLTCPLRVHLAKTPINSADVFLYHKTTHRQVYNQARQEYPTADDVLLWNERGELTESCIANLVVQLNGNWYTPPVRCGLLAGTFRSWLLNQGKVQEQVISVEDLSRCSKIFLVNSVSKQQVAQIVT